MLGSQLQQGCLEKCHSKNRQNNSVEKPRICCTGAYVCAALVTPASTTMRLFPFRSNPPPPSWTRRRCPPPPHPQPQGWQQNAQKHTTCQFGCAHKKNLDFRKNGPHENTDLTKYGPLRCMFSRVCIFFLGMPKQTNTKCLHFLGVIGVINAQPQLDHAVNALSVAAGVLEAETGGQQRCIEKQPHQILDSHRGREICNIFRSHVCPHILGEGAFWGPRSGGKQTQKTFHKKTWGPELDHYFHSVAQFYPENVWNDFQGEINDNTYSSVVVFGGFVTFRSIFWFQNRKSMGC